MKKVILLLALMSALCVQSLCAQAIKGDMNDDAMLDVTDANELTNTMLGKQPVKYVQGGGDPYMVDNSRVVGTWYKTKSDHFTLNADGTTDYSGAATFKFLPYQGCIMFFDASGVPVTFIDVRVLEEGYMVCIPRRTDVLTVLTTTQPAQPVTAIQLSATNLEIFVGESQQISATVLPADADNKSVTWSSSNESVAKLSGDLILAIASGTAVITCSAADGSGVKAECTVSVKPVAHEYVDLGLPGGVLWATCNVGADKPEDYGLYFAWGETKGYAIDESHGFTWADYKWCNGSYDRMTKYCTSSSYGKVDNKTALDPEDDAATANWGAGWRMPTEQELIDLYNSNYTTTEWVTENGVKGRKITSKSNGNSIFLPAAGHRNGSTFGLQRSYGYYWSSSLRTNDCTHAYHLNFNSGGIDWGYNNRSYGQSVRAVRVGSE